MTIWFALAVFAHILGFISSFSALTNGRTSQGTIAWLISLNTIPYIAVPAYWVLGRSHFHGYVQAREMKDEAVESRLKMIFEDIAPYQLPPQEYSNSGHAAELLANIPLTVANKVDLLIDGDRTFDSIVEGIDSAKNYVLFQFFIVKDDGIGRRIKEHLLKKLAEGVKVYFLYDEVGSNKLGKAYQNELRKAGCQILPFNTRKGKGNRFQLNFRNHRKIVVVDGTTAWIGGHNVGDEYIGLDPKFGHWRDTHVRITGPAALAAQYSFVEDWHWAADTMIVLDWTPVPSEDGADKVLVIASGPADEVETATLMFLHTINSATERIWIASPYFVPDDQIVSALQLACLRGVDVRILIPDMPDHLSVYLAAYSYFDEVGKMGARFYRYSDGFLHQKAMLVDKAVAAVGTANFDNRSFRLNFEVTAIVLNEDFAKQIESMFLADFADSREMVTGELDEKSLWFRMGVKLARLTSPVQ